MRGRAEKKQRRKLESDTELPVCDVCGQNHSTECCIFISDHPCIVKDAVTPTRARLTLPANLAVKDLADGTTTVVTKAKFARGTRFGPFIAPLISILPPEVNFPLKIFGESEKESFYLDTRSEDDCNWMCLVGSVSSSNETQNLLCYQVLDNIFFSLLHDVGPGEELRVWYAPFYGIKMGISPGRFASSAASEALEISEGLLKVEEPVTWEADTTTADILSPEEDSLITTRSRRYPREEKKQLLKDGVQEQKKIDNEARTAYVAQQLPPKRLGARFTPACWRCRECGTKEESVISYARHLMQHLKPRSKKFGSGENDSKYSCALCDQKFFSQGLLDDHVTTQHNLSDLVEESLREELGEISAEPDDPLPMEECSEEESHIRAVGSPLNILEKSNDSYNKDEKSCESEEFLVVPHVQQTCDINPLPRSTTDLEENSSVNGSMVMNCESVLASNSDIQQNIRINSSVTTYLEPVKSTESLQENTERLEENCRKLVAVMGENALQNLLIPIDQQKNIDLLLQSFQPPSREKPETHPTKVPETILNHEFFTRVAGDTVVRDVKSLLSMGYSLQFLVENEDGSSSLVDVLSTGSGLTTNSVTSGVSQNGEVSSQQLVIMANGNVPDSLPQALQGILPPSVPIVPSVTPQSPLLANPSIDSMTHDNTVTDDVQLPSCLDSEDSFLNKQNSAADARSPLGTLLPSVITNNMCYDNVVSYGDSNSENASLMEMSLSGENLEREELDYELGALELPLAVDDTNSTDYMINACTSPSPNTARSSNLCVESNPDLNTPVKMLDHCIEGTLSADVMAFDFEASSHVPRSNILRSPRPEEKNSVCREELPKDFSDLIAADAESSNVMLTIQPADSTAELRKDDSISSIDVINNNEKEKSSTTLEWMGSEGLLLSVQRDSVEHTPQTLILNTSEKQSVEIGFQPINEIAKSTMLLKDNSEESRLLQVSTSEINTELDGLLLDAHSDSQNAVPTVDELPSNLESHLQLRPKDQMQSATELHLQLPCQPQGALETPFQQQIHSQVLSQVENQHWLATPSKIFTTAHSQYQSHCQSHKQNEVQMQVQMKMDTEVQAQMELQIQAETIPDVQPQHQPVSVREQELHPSSDLAVAEDAEMDVEQSSISNGPPFVCDICNKSFGKMDYLYRHLRKHTGEFTCVGCCAVFARKETLQLHDCPAQPTRSRENGVQLKCPFCHKHFPEKKQLTRHLVSHTGSRRYQCTICGSNFSSKEAAEQHIRKCSSKSPSANERSSQPLSLLVIQEGANATSEPKAQNTIHPLRCDTCRRMFSSEAGLQRHEMTEHHDSTKDCMHCGRQLALATPDRVALHTRICAPAAALQAGNADSAICPECNEPFRQLLLYRQHVYRHTHPLSCAHCHRSFRTLQERGKHVCLDLLEQCCQCGHRFGTVPQLERHALTHGVPHYHCYECGRSFHLMTDFKHHRCFELSLKVQRRASKKEDLSATSVVSSTSVKRNSSQSQRSDSEEVLMCEICGEVCKSKWALKAHHLLHGERKIECGVCGKRFHRKDVLLEHMYVHEEAQLRCTICNKLLKSKKALDVHIRQQHCSHKRFACQHCNKEFHQKANLHKHMKIHETSRQQPQPQPVTCTHCGRSFPFPEDLAKHMAEHAEITRFPCNHCDRTFVKEKSLSQHMRLHGPRSHASRGFSCPACGHTLKHRNSLRRHIIKNHPELTYGRKMISEDHVQPAANNMEQPQSPEVLLTVSQLQLTTDGVQQVSLPEEVPVENACLLEEDAMECAEDMVLYVLQEPLSCLPLQEPSS